MKKRYLSEGTEWDFDLLKIYDAEIAKIAKGYNLDTYPIQVEVISAEQMMDAYSSVGMPVGYHHWSYGKHFLNVEKNYKRGTMGLAYEIVINSDPCIAYLMEENTMTMQAIVLAHAAYGHNSFFKGNYLFRSWTSPDSIIDYLLFAKKYITSCEERYGVEQVELILDSCHALMNYGVDRYKRPAKLSLVEEKKQQREREEYLQSQVNDLWRTIPKGGLSEDGSDAEKFRFPKEPQENILYFVEKNAPLLESWQREVVRIVRKISQYFYPQRQTQVMNEGWATFWHYTIMQDLYANRKINEGAMIEFLQSHTNVVFQPTFNSPHYSGINPYALGFNMYKDLRRICEQPSEEDERWFPEIVHTDWVKTLDFAMRNFKDESFIAQFLSPNVIREMRLFSVMDDDQEDELKITAIHNEDGYRDLRQLLAEQYNLSNNEPNIQIYNTDVRGDRSLTLRHVQHHRKPLGQTTQEVLRHIHRLWGFPIYLESVTPAGKIVNTERCPPLE
jgi:stage V sporulation protein R